jgi:hypothetical protein
MSTAHLRTSLTFAALTSLGALASAACGCTSVPEPTDGVASVNALAASDPLASGHVYRITSVASGLAVDVTGVSKERAANAQQWADWGGPNQRWRLQSAGDGTFYVVSVNSGMCLDVSGVSTSGGADVWQWPCIGGENQKWRFDPRAGGAYALVSVNSQQCLDVRGASHDPGARLQQWPCYLVANQSWILEDVGEGAPAPPPAPSPQPAPARFAAIFYFTGFGDSLYSASNTAPSGDAWIMQGQSPAYGPYGSSNFWGKPEWAATHGDGTIENNYRFYLNGNPDQPNDALLDWHADLLSAAGIDTVVLDFTNGAADFPNGPSYISATRALCNRWQARMNASLPTPKIAFFVKDEDTLARVETEYFARFRGDLFFEYLGKKLLLVAAPDSSRGADDRGQPAVPTSGRFANYTARHTWGLDASGSSWQFKVATDEPAPPFMYHGNPEQMSAPVASQASYMTMDGVTPTAGAQGRRGGAFFTKYMDAAIRVKPTFVFIHSWNEWTAGNWHQDDPGRPYIVDQWLEEYSSDIEPMAGGHGSFYYELMKRKVGEFKAAR